MASAWTAQIIFDAPPTKRIEIPGTAENNIEERRKNRSGRGTGYINMKKFVLFVIGIITTIICFILCITLSIILLFSDFRQGKAFLIIMFMLIISCFVLIAFKCFKAVLPNKGSDRSDTIMTGDSNVANAALKTSRDTAVDTSHVSEQASSNNIITPETIVPTFSSEAETETRLSDTCIESGNIIYRADNQPISDEEIPYLIQVGYEKALEKDKLIPKRTPREEDLCDHFMMNHSSDIGYHVDKFEKLCDKAYSEQDLDKKIELLKQTILEYEKAKRWFYRTKGGTIYFEDMYEHLHNSQNNDFSYIDSVQATLDYYTSKKDIVIPQILSAIGNKGIIQKDIYDLVESDKSDIRNVIRELETEGMIKGEKKGNSYWLTLE